MKIVRALLLLVSVPLFAQSAEDISFQRTFLLRNVTGTVFNPGTTPHHPHMSESGPWSTFFEGAAFATFSSETGPAQQRNKVFSTNWLAGGAQRTFGTRSLLLLRGRVSLEPLTIAEEGYPQMLQFVPPQVDNMRAHDLVGEAAVDFAYRTSTSSFVHLYAAPVGTPALGTVPFAQRASSEEFAEAPFAYDLQETQYDSTSVITAGFASRWVILEGSVFHDAESTGRHTTIESGSIDSNSVRLTFTPTQSVAVQYSHGEIGTAGRSVESGSITWASRVVSASAIYTSRDNLKAGTLEATFRFVRNTVMVRVENVDRPVGFLSQPRPEQTTHFTAGYIFDALLRTGYRGGIGFNVDYHTQSKELPARYGHKPQALYAFVRLRTDATRK